MNAVETNLLPGSSGITQIHRLTKWYNYIRKKNITFSYLSLKQSIPKGASPLVPQTVSKSKGVSPLVPQTVSKSKVVSPLVPQTESKPKDNMKDIIKTKPTTKANPSTKPKHNIYSRIKYECKECKAEFENQIALTTHSYSHNRRYQENTEYFDINSSQNMKEFYILIKVQNTLKI